jgi:LmbE family N-acetylglucosaminyl deacetylase
MPLTAPQRLQSDRQTPRILALWRGLQPLRTLVRFMNSGAHPDDETSAMLAVLGFRDGINLSYVCANRGEGGQNDIGREATEDLGTVRTAEMEQAAQVLDMRLYWLSQTPADSIFDFGFSKSGQETLAKWTHERTLARLVEVVRSEKPDILCPTFLDIPGQHGHHRAMTQAAHEVMERAADPGFAGSNLPVWQVSKLYLPAWSGAGGAYDDEVPPPPATLTVAGKGQEELSGWSYERIGQHSRWFHKTQGMGHWVSPGRERDWPLHLAVSHVGADVSAVTDNLPMTLRDLDAAAGDHAALTSAQLAIHDAVAAFPDRAGVLKAAQAGYRALAAMEPPAQIAHHVGHKLAQLGRVIMLASGADVRGWLAEDYLAPGQTTGLTIETRQPDHGQVNVSLDLPDGWGADTISLSVGRQAPPADPYPALFDPLVPARPALRVSVDGAQCLLPLEVPPMVLPKVMASLSMDARLINLANPRQAIKLSLLHSSGGKPAFKLPEGWGQNWDGSDVVLSAPDDLQAGLYDLALTLDGEPAFSARRFAYPHIAPRLRSFTASLKVRVMNVALPKARIGYIGGGHDRVAYWLKALGCEVIELDEQALAMPGALEGIDSLLVGVFAIRYRPDLRAKMVDIHQWVRAGGNLVTLYHRPWDFWDADVTPPARLEIGQPSLRWRVTDENASVTHLIPDHALLNTPNTIGPRDWMGWHKERGLYFAKSWDRAYEPLLQMADPGEAPHKGALLCAKLGKGRHVHCALILHHQMEKLTPGAFALMANLLERPFERP